MTPQPPLGGAVNGKCEMKEIKITNYTTKDWLKQFGSMFCSLFLAQWAFHAFKDGDWFHGTMHCLGAVGWLLIYLRINREIRRKNPQ